MTSTNQTPMISTPNVSGTDFHAVVTVDKIFRKKKSQKKIHVVLEFYNDLYSLGSLDLSSLIINIIQKNKKVSQLYNLYSLDDKKYYVFDFVTMKYYFDNNYQYIQNVEFQMDKNTTLLDLYNTRQLPANQIHLILDLNDNHYLLNEYMYLLTMLETKTNCSQNKYTKGIRRYLSYAYRYSLRRFKMFEPDEETKKCFYLFSRISRLRKYFQNLLRFLPENHFDKSKFVFLNPPHDEDTLFAYLKSKSKERNNNDNYFKSNKDYFSIKFDPVNAQSTMSEPTEEKKSIGGRRRKLPTYKTKRKYKKRSHKTLRYHYQ